MVSSALRERGAEPIRLDTDLYPEHVQVSTSVDGDRWRKLMKVGDRVFDLDEVEALWYRRFFAGGALPDGLGDTLHACISESRRTLYGVIAALGCFELDPLAAVRTCDHKELQLRRAVEFGLSIPATIFTNDPYEAEIFFDEQDGQIIAKMQSSFAVNRDGEEQVVFTTPVSVDDLDDLDGLRFAPMIFQAHVKKAFELRSTVVGKQVFTARIDSQASDETSVDWRRDGVGLIDSWVPYQLPEDVQASLLRLTESFGLNYAAADFMVTPEGGHVFLEINAGGEWFWIQRNPGLPIAEALADTLLGRVERI